MRASLALLAVLALAACSRREAAAQAEADRASGAVKLLDPGSEPRRSLRFHPEAGATSTMRFTSHETPSSRAHQLTLRARVAEITDAGARCEFQVIGADLPEGSLSGSVIATSRGTVVEREWRSMTMMAYSFKPALNQWSWDLAPSLPADPIGIGARWRVERRTWKDIYDDVHETVDYRLAAFDGRRATIEVELAQSAPPQPLMLTNPASGEGGKLLEMAGWGTGRLEIDLGGLPIAFGHSAVEVHDRLLHSLRGKETEHERTERVEIDVGP